MMEQVHVSKFGGGGVAGLEDFICATLPTTPLDFQGKVKNFCHPTLLKIRFKISVIPPLLEKGQSQNYGASINYNGLLTSSGLLIKPQVLVTHDNFFHQHISYTWSTKLQQNLSKAHCGGS